MSLKRILKELHTIIPDKLIETDIFDKFYFIEIGNHIICREIGVINKKNNNMEIRFTIDNCYPFKPPKVFVCNNKQDICYLRWLSKIVDYKKYDISNLNFLNLIEKNFNAWVFSIIKWPLFKNYLKFPDKGICYCCESIICNNQWSPCLSLYNLLFEYIICNQFFIYSTDLNQKLINTIFKNEKWIIPNDIIQYIIAFL